VSGSWSKGLVVSGALLLAAPFLRAAAALDVDAGALVNWSCLRLRIGVCGCGVPPEPCLRVRYHEPRLLIHTRAAPGGKPGHESPQQFNEATAVPFPLHLFREFFSFPCSVDWSQPATGLQPLNDALSSGAHYSSLLDRVAWRTGAVEMWAAQSIASTVTTRLGACAVEGLAGQLGITVPGLGNVCIGNWGPLFARTGWLVHPSEPVGSAAAAYRAAHILSHPEFLAGHVVPWPATDFRASTANLMQLALPRMTRCFRPGTPPSTWEHATGSPIGQYVWVYWVERSCCVEASKVAGLLAATPRGAPVAALGPSGPGSVEVLPAAAGACRADPAGWSVLPLPRSPS